MTHDNALLPKPFRQRLTGMVRMARKDKVGLRGQDIEPQGFEFRGNPPPLANDAFTRGLKPVFILKCRNGARLSQTVKRIGVEAVLDAIQGLDNLRATNGETDT